MFLFITFVPVARTIIGDLHCPRKRPPLTLNLPGLTREGDQCSVLYHE
jgi:hypothetical protein